VLIDETETVVPPCSNPPLASEKRNGERNETGELELYVLETFPRNAATCRLLYFPITGFLKTTFCKVPERERETTKIN
jgi:hypothetical protein